MDKKIYTLINSFTVSDYSEPDEIWIANYANREDAIKAFNFKIHESCERVGIDGFNEDGTIKPYIIAANDTIGKWTVEELFEELASNGYCIIIGEGSSADRWFIRQEPIQTTYNEEAIDCS